MRSPCTPSRVRALLRRELFLRAGCAVLAASLAGRIGAADASTGPRPEWRDETRLHEGTEPPAATMALFADESSARGARPERSPFRVLLNGDWKYHWSPNPAARVAYHVNSQWAVAAEQYSGFGPLRELVPRTEQVQQIWAAFHHYATMNIEGGVGFGLTPASDKLTLKLMFSRDLN